MRDMPPRLYSKARCLRSNSSGAHQLCQPIVPAGIVPTIAPIAPAAVSPSAVAPPITPGELLLAGAQFDDASGNIGNRLTNGGQPFANKRTVCSRQLRVRWM